MFWICVRRKKKHGWAERGTKWERTRVTATETQIVWCCCNRCTLTLLFQQWCDVCEYIVITTCHAPLSWAVALWFHSLLWPEPDCSTSWKVLPKPVGSGVETCCPLREAFSAASTLISLAAPIVYNFVFLVYFYGFFRAAVYEACESMTTLLRYKYTIVSLEVLGMDLHVLDSGREASLHTSMPPFPLYGMSLCIWCPFCFAVAVHSPSDRTLHFFSPCSVTILYSPFSPYLFSSHCPFIFHSAPLSLSSLPLSLSPFPISLCLPPPLCLSPVWYQAGMAVQVSCSGLFHWSSLSTPVKSGTNVCTLHF